jgi:uncharacterized protein YhbP (UPF0306 family)
MVEQSDEVRRAALGYLEAHHVMTLATSGDEGVWAATVFYASDGFDLYFLSAGHTRHGQNLMAKEWAAATIQEDYHDWPTIQGIQLEGGVTLLEGEARQAAIERYEEKYPFVANPPDERMKRALTKVNWYRLRPERLYFIDNSKGLGHRDQLIGHP